MVFQEFPAMNDQHKSKYDAMSGNLFTGDPTLIHEKVEREGEEEARRKAEAEKAA